MEIDPEINYPEDWIVFRITGYRPEIREPATFVGGALLADVSGLIERLSSAAKIHESELEPGQFLDVDEVCARWKVSRKTLERWRRQGLVARRVRGENGKPRLAFSTAVVERFEQGRAGSAEHGYSRIGAQLEARMLRRAGAYAKLGCSLNQAAKRISARYGRAHETVRQLLKRHERTGALFAHRGPATERERRLMARAAWACIEPAVIARKLDRSSAAVHRVLNDERAERLRMLAEMIGGSGPGFTGDQSVLEPEPVRSGLGEAGPTDLLELVRGARAAGVPLGVVERAQGLAHRFLLARVQGLIADLPAHGARATALDRIETDLRWACRLKTELVRSQLPLLVRVLESSLGKPLEEVRSGRLGPLLQGALGAIGDAVDAYDPDKGGRLAAGAGIGLNRIAAKFVREQAIEPPSRTRAVGMLGPGVRVDDWTRRVSPWQTWRGHAWLEPRSLVRAGLRGLGETERQLVCARFGWGPAPATLVEIAARMGLTVMRAAAIERAALRACLRAGSGE